MRKLAIGCALVCAVVLAMASAKINLTANASSHPGSEAARVANPTSRGTNGAQFNSDAQCVSTVPRSWGIYRGGSNQAGLAFEASDGTLRFITNLPCGAVPVIALEVRRTGNGAGN